MRTLTTLLCLLAVGAGCPVGSGQIAARATNAKQSGLLTATERPDLAVDFESSAKLKLASRKTNYRLGEMIGIDLALMNTSGMAVSFIDPHYTDLTLGTVDARGKQITVGAYRETLHGATHNDYQLVQPGDLMLAHFQVVAGCDSEAFRIAREDARIYDIQGGTPGPGYSKAVLDRNLFVSWGDQCMAIQTGGTYTITAKYENEFVVLAPGGPKTKTAVGTIVSNPLTVTITE